MSSFSSSTHHAGTFLVSAMWPSLLRIFHGLKPLLHCPLIRFTAPHMDGHPTWVQRSRLQPEKTQTPTSEALSLHLSVGIRPCLSELLPLPKVESPLDCIPAAHERNDYY